MNRNAIILICLLSGSAFAYVFGDSNLGFGGYPQDSCLKPVKPYKFTSEWQRETFITEVERYMDCIREYVDAADNDIQRINEARDSAINEANSFVQSLKY